MARNRPLLLLSDDSEDDAVALREWHSRTPLTGNIGWILLGQHSVESPLLTWRLMSHSICPGGFIWIVLGARRCSLCVLHYWPKTPSYYVLGI